MLRSIYAVAIDFILVLFFREFMVMLGINEVLATYASPILVIFCHLLTLIDVKVLKKVYMQSMVKPLIMEVDGGVIYNEVRISRVVDTVIALNSCGFIVPVLISSAMTFTLLTHYVWYKLLIMFLSMTLILCIVFNRLTVVKRGCVGILITKSLLITVILGTALGIAYSPQACFAVTYMSAFSSLLIGNDIPGLKYALSDRPKIMSIGGAGTADSLVLLPALSALLSKYASSLLIAVVPSL